MKLLLDTHVLLWWLIGSDRLDSQVATEIEDGNNHVLVSAVSVWEIEIKRAKGALVAPSELLEMLAQQRIELLDCTAAHATSAGRLPQIHSDPFDRMLVAQAAIEGAVLVTADGALARYDVAVRRAESS